MTLKFQETATLVQIYFLFFLNQVEFIQKCWYFFLSLFRFSRLFENNIVAMLKFVGIKEKKNKQGEGGE